MRLPGALLLGLAILAGGTLLFNRGADRWLLRQDAEAAALRWAAEFNAALGEALPALLAGQPPEAATLAALQRHGRIGDVFRFRLFDAAGRPVFASDEPAPPAAELAAHRRDGTLARRLLAGATHVEMAHRRHPGDPTFYAEAYVPALHAGRQVGVIEVHLDRAGQYALYRRTFTIAGAGALLLMLLGAALPTLVAIRGNRERQDAEEWVRFLAQHDPLTDLPNRARFAEALTAALARARRDGSLVGVLTLDLDGFKEVNGTLGQAAGDALLRRMAERLQRMTRAEDTVARLGGDEFAVVQVGLETPADAGHLAERLLALLAEPYELPGGQRTGCTASIGIAIAPADGEDVETLLRGAAAALYRAKQEGPGTARCLEPGMDQALAAQRKLTQDLRLAVADGAFDLAFQPLHTLADARLVGFEALLRWPHPERGLIPPADFIPLAEETGLIVPLGAWVLRRACREAASWPGKVRVAVNLSPAQFHDGAALVQTVRDALAAANLPAQRLELEVTEGLLVRDPGAALAILEELRKLGCSIVMDDFGTGYSSLAYLWRFPFDKLKIDRSFVAGMSGEPKAAAIVATIVALGHSLGLAVTAEGIETVGQVGALNATGCELGQGYLLGRPMPAEAARELSERVSAPAAE
ncbi:bifunctional diguanylate cyclase/phosphodiesterase [Siccirubricoccus sp. KC 17139]|uniref:Bifunctional diguanylate cyclase/phosphodiesterase n=1 Tax=Siccirubricoccus soli TaxID=2899147 RepID=A0ABT1D3S1_9PROT|nr:bifunctional diguanylate cyclase/phosphodiesterase [Siccirubricoccus soli]MCO6416570.1 bifunctional diguanylate cyclase/phosphodiesterase [Siccirubricoccus soli]MCP2682705.1 bifunctional diguanylate cyclase/phosphodiesterase [Siccirubricoccus soli]